MELSVKQILILKWKWYDLYKVGKVRAKTLANYEGYLKKHLLPYFRPRDICTITIDDVQEFMRTAPHSGHDPQRSKRRWANQHQPGEVKTLTQFLQ